MELLCMYINCMLDIDDQEVGNVPEILFEATEKVFILVMEDHVDGRVPVMRLLLMRKRFIRLIVLHSSGMSPDNRFSRR